MAMERIFQILLVLLVLLWPVWALFLVFFRWLFTKGGASRRSMKPLRMDKAASAGKTGYPRTAERMT
jgi:hypothetical protein